MSSQYRSHRVAELRAEHIGQSVTLAGFIQRKRSMGSVVFVELRDAGALVQCVVEATSGEAFEALSAARVESVVSLSGVVTARPAGTHNERHERGGLELRVARLEVLSAADVLPFAIASDIDPPEELRLRYRYLDLRRTRLRRNLLLRAQLVARLRQLLSERDFIEVTTPILTSSSPEGARDFLVPSPAASGQILRAAASSAAVQAATHGGGHRSLLSDCSVFSRRGRAPRSLSGRILPAGLGAGLRR